MSYDKKCPRFVDPVRGWVNPLIRTNTCPRNRVKIDALLWYDISKDSTIAPLDVVGLGYSMPSLQTPV